MTALDFEPRDHHDIMLKSVIERLDGLNEAEGEVEFVAVRDDSGLVLVNSAWGPDRSDLPMTIDAAKRLLAMVLMEQDKVAIEEARIVGDMLAKARLAGEFKRLQGFESALRICIDRAIQMQETPR